MTGTCTMARCATTGQLVPWGSQRLCLPCADEQIDLLAQAVRLVPTTWPEAA